MSGPTLDWLIVWAENGAEADRKTVEIALRESDTEVAQVFAESQARFTALAAALRELCDMREAVAKVKFEEDHIRRVADVIEANSGGLHLPLRRIADRLSALTKLAE